MDMDKCIGMMVVYTKVIGKTVFSMERDKYSYQDRVEGKDFLKIMF